MKPTKVKKPAVKPMFASVAAAAAALCGALANTVEAAHELENAKALGVEANKELQQVIDECVNSKFTVGKSPRGETDAAKLRAALHEWTEENRATLSKKSRENLVTCVAKCINGYPFVNKKGEKGTSHRFKGFNPARYNPTNNGGGGPDALIKKSDSAYSINAKRDDSAERLAGAIQQFGAWIMTCLPEDTPANDPRVMLAAYLKDAIDVTQGTK